MRRKCPKRMPKSGSSGKFAAFNNSKIMSGLYTNTDCRNSLHQMDFRTREIEQNHLTKDLQQHEQSERLKEEIRILEGDHLTVM